MHFIDAVFQKNRELSGIYTALEKGSLPAAVTGMSPIHRAAFISSAVSKTGRRAVVLCPDEAEASRLVSDLEAFGKKALLLPSRELLSGAGVTSSKEWEHKRLYTLSALADGAFSVCAGSAEAFCQLTLPPDVLRRSTFTLKAGQSIAQSELLGRLVSAGYTFAEQTDGAGQFSHRGGIVDIFPTGLPSPVRIEFWGDEIDSIAYFDTESQRRGDSIGEVGISPAREALFEKEQLCEKLSARLKSRKKLTDRQRSVIEQDLKSIETDTFTDWDKYLPFGFDRAFSALDFAGGEDMLFVCDSSAAAERIRGHLAHLSENIKQRLETGESFGGCDCYCITHSELLAHAERLGTVFLETFARSSYGLPLKETTCVSMSVLPPWRGGFDTLCEEMGGNTAILAGTQKAARLLCDELCKNGFGAVYLKDPPDEIHGICVLEGGVSAGIRIPQQDFTLITHSNLLKAKKAVAHKKGQGISSPDELHAGTLVVHSVHGIGRFLGISKIENNGIVKDYMKIQYAKGDVLYVPVTQLDLVSRYIGGRDDDAVKLNRLGSGEWQKTRTRVRAAVRDMAKQLTALYAKRMQVKGHAFSPDTDIQSDFERRFEYEETDDQLRCINEIKADMERPVPMDRLLCGDVGFGKTEVALRAAFKCVSEGKQCALMAPTTILAWQHFNTVRRRFGDFPLEVRLLSRFVSKSEQNKTLAGLRRGSVDMVVGTHRLISKDVKFRDLGLIIIDEEHRFGVAQKEKLKELYPNIDVLTLSATPIPRTLNMAMSGLRDMSSIDEAPEDRQPVQTYVLEQDNGILLDAIDRELRRGGQVYYLHNRVGNIEACAARLHAALPDARIGIAHGQMDEETLSAVWKQLLDHEIDILVCTTIIETGVDVPNANTLIIEDADMMGLSQLHQLRGRVGRSPRRAYAYFCFRRGKGLSEVAEKRLEAIREYTEFGSGFKIAMRDLEIRGAGSLLGGEQHGHLESVGYDMYLKLLSEAISEEKGEPVKQENNCVVDVSISAHIPESYIPNLPQRLGIYRRIADIKNDADASDVIDELCDHFGEPPRAVLGLIDVALIRNRAAALGIEEIGQSGKSILLYCTTISPEYSSALLSHFGNRFMIGAGKRAYYSVKPADRQTTADCLKEIMSCLPRTDN